MTVEPDVERSTTANDLRPVHPSGGGLYTVARHAAHVTFIAVAVIALFWRVFFLGETLIDVNTLNNQLPWGYHAGQSNYPYNRRDLTDTYVTRDYFVAAAYREGEFPLWNPYTMAGHPIYADGVTRTLSPFLLFYRFFDIPLGYSLARIFELMLAAVFMYVFLVAIGAGASGGLMGSLVFAFSAHSMLHLTGLGWWGGLMWLPLVLLFVDRAISHKSYAQAMLAGVFLAAQFFCGYLPNQIYYVGAVILYYLFFAFRARRGDSSSRSGARLLAMMVVTLAIGLSLAATQWVPSLELLSYSNRKIVGAELGYVYLPPWYAGTLVFPNLFGAAYDTKMLTVFTALGVSHDHILYLGIAALVPLGFCLYWLRQTSRKRDDNHLFQTLNSGSAARNHIAFFAALAALSLIIMMTAPLYVPVTRYIPVLQVIRDTVHAGVLFLFGASVLVAFGTDLLLQSGAGALRPFSKLARRFAIWIVAFVMLAVLGSYLVSLSGFAFDTGERGRLAFIRRTAGALTAQFTPPNLSVLITLGLLCTAALLVWALCQRRVSAGRFFALLTVLLMVDLFWNSSQFNHSFDRSRVFPKTEITDLLHSLPPGRVLVVPSDLETNRRVANEPIAHKIIAPPNTLLPYQLATVTGKNQQFPKWYREFASLIEPQQNLSHVVFDEYSSPFFDLLNVRYVMTHESAARLAGYDLLATAEGVSLYENREAMPRAFFARDVIEVESASASLEVLREAGFDPHTAAVIETGNRVATAPNSRPPRAYVFPKIIEDRRNRVVIETNFGEEGLLVVSDNYYPGWRAFVDGLPTEVFRANHTMRAVNVPAGHHMVSFAFMPATLFVSIYSSLAAAALILVALILGAVKRRRSNSYDIRQDHQDG
ncbi:MAG: YfhO family protein [Acidobacteriota bacterium]